jgi:hypothetical protein
MQPDPLLIPISTVCDRLSIGRTAFYQLRQSGGFGPAVLHLGGKLLVRASDLVAWVEAGLPPMNVWQGRESVPQKSAQQKTFRPVATGAVLCTLKGGRQ